MSQAPAAASGLVRVTVASGARRVDLVLPGAVPVAELVPELARSVGLLDAATVYGGYRIVTADGRPLAGDLGLLSQGVEDGGLLTVGAGVDEPPPRVYDDVVEAMTDVVERDLTPWRPASGRRTALVAAALLLALGLVALFAQRESLLAGVATTVAAACLLGSAIVLSRAQREPEAAVAVAWMGVVYAAAAGLMLGEHTWHEGLFGLAWVAAGGGALVAGVLGVLGLGPGRALLLPGAVVGGLVLAAGLVLQATDLDAAVLMSVVLVVLVLIGSVFPWLALGMTGTDVEQLFSAADITADPDEIDPGSVAGDARVAHELLVAITATVGLLLVLVAPLAVGLGVAGTLLAVCASLVVMFRTRQYRVGAEVLVGLVSGLAGLVVTALSLIAQHPDWQPTAAVVLAGAGAALLATTLLPGEASLRRGRLGDVAESVTLLLLLPLLVMASGLIDAVHV